MRRREHRAAFRVWVNREMRGLTQPVRLQSTGFGREGDGWRGHGGVEWWSSGALVGRGSRTTEGLREGVGLGWLGVLLGRETAEPCGVLLT
jgi:hypothetical protein